MKGIASPSDGAQHKVISTESVGSLVTKIKSQDGGKCDHIYVVILLCKLLNYEVSTGD